MCLCVWYTQNLHDAKHLRRKLERKWRQSKLTIDHQIYRSSCANVNKMLKQAKIDYYSDKVSSYGKDQKSLHTITKHLLLGSTEAALPTGKSSNELAQNFSDFFIDKVQGIRNDITTHMRDLIRTLSNMTQINCQGIHPSFRSR